MKHSLINLWLNKQKSGEVQQVSADEQHKNVLLKVCKCQRESATPTLPPKLRFQVGRLTPMSALHLARASAVTFGGERFEPLPARPSAKLSPGQRTVRRGQLSVPLPRRFCMRAAPSLQLLPHPSHPSILSLFLFSPPLRPPRHLSRIR